MKSRAPAGHNSSISAGHSTPQRHKLDARDFRILRVVQHRCWCPQAPSNRNLSVGSLPLTEVLCALECCQGMYTLLTEQQFKNELVKSLQQVGAPLRRGNYLPLRRSSVATARISVGDYKERSVVNCDLSASWSSAGASMMQRLSRNTQADLAAVPETLLSSCSTKSDVPPCSRR